MARNGASSLARAQRPNQAGGDAATRGVATRPWQRRVLFLWRHGSSEETRRALWWRAARLRLAELLAPELRQHATVPQPQYPARASPATMSALPPRMQRVLGTMPALTPPPAPVGRPSRMKVLRLVARGSSSARQPISGMRWHVIWRKRRVPGSSARTSLQASGHSTAAIGFRAWPFASQPSGWPRPKRRSSGCARVGDGVWVWV